MGGWEVESWTQSSALNHRSWEGEEDRAGERSAVWEKSGAPWGRIKQSSLVVLWSAEKHPCCKVLSVCCLLLMVRFRLWAPHNVLNAVMKMSHQSSMSNLIKRLIHCETRANLALSVRRCFFFFSFFCKLTHNSVLCPVKLATLSHFSARYCHMIIHTHCPLGRRGLGVK